MTAPTSRWSLFGLLAQQRRFIYLAVALLSAAGIWAAYTLPSAIYPELQFYRVTIVAEGSSLGARQQLFGVTRTLEEAVSIVPGVIRVQSKSIRGASEINVMFSPTTDMVDALQQVRARVAQVQPELPTGLDIVTERQVPSLFPILSYNLEGGDPATLFDIARYQVKPVLSRVPGVGRIEVLGNDMREIEVVADPARLAAQGMTYADLAEAISKATTVAAVGRMPANYKQYLIVSATEAHSVDDVANVVIGHGLRVRDVAKVFAGTEDHVRIIAGDGKPVAQISTSATSPSPFAVRSCQRPCSKRASVSSSPKRMKRLRSRSRATRSRYCWISGPGTNLRDQSGLGAKEKE